MKAFVIHNGGHKVSFVDRPAPVIQHPRDVLVQVKTIGVCGTDLHIFEGKHPMCFGQDRIPGHEFSGEVIAVGDEVTSFKQGDRVVHEPISYCGDCYPCRRGQNNVCTSLKVTGCNIDGGWQEYYCAQENQWHKIPDWITWEQATLIEPYTIAAQVCNQGDVRADDIVLIQGGGPVGLMCCDTAKQLGAKVIVSEPMERRQILAKELGADLVINPLEEDLETAINQKGWGAVNVVLDCVGLANMVEPSIKMLSPAGRFVPVAVCPIHIEAGAEVMRKQLTIIGSRLQQGQFIPVIEKFKHYGPHAETMITNVFSFQESGEAFEYANARNPECGKVIVSFLDSDKQS